MSSKQTPTPSPNTLYQYSLALSLMDGVAQNGLPLPTLFAHGSFNPHGLGTFRGMRGEMIVLDHSIFQMKSDGGILPIDTSDPSIITPFAQITSFRPSHTRRLRVSSKNDLADAITQLAGPASKNHFVAIRVDGPFRTVTTRTAEGQNRPGEKLEEVSARQVNQTHERVRGTMVGFRSPRFAHGVSVAGDHLHFITDDRQRGGHVLGLEGCEEGDEGEEIELKVAVITKLNLELPPAEDEEYAKADLVLDAQGLHNVEG